MRRGGRCGVEQLKEQWKSPPSYSPCSQVAHGNRGRNTASACAIRDFSAVATCDDSGNGVIRVTDTDVSGTPATVSLYIKMTVPGEEDRLLDTKTIEHPDAQGVSIDFAQNWAPDSTYRIHIKAGNQVDEDIKPLLTTPSQACSATETSPRPRRPRRRSPPRERPPSSRLRRRAPPLPPNPALAAAPLPRAAPTSPKPARSPTPR